MGFWDTLNPEARIAGEATSPEKKVLRRHVGWVYLFAVQNRPPGNKIATTILKTTMLSICKATSRETLGNKEACEIMIKLIFMK